MEGRKSTLESIPEEEILDNDQDVDMLDVEEGELEGEQNQPNEPIEMSIQEPCSRNRRRWKKKRNKKKNGSVSNITDINRFVIDTCRHLKEKKSYLVWAAVGCLGIAALGDLVREVKAIQACGGQMTADGKRPRTGGGILWNILKVREPKAYKEIMTKGKEFEKQLRKQGIRQPLGQKEGSSQRSVCASSDGISDHVADDLPLATKTQSEAERNGAQGRRTSVLNRIRIPVAYEDLVEEDPKDEFT
ncbi:PREDICTED: uncharacterized protein LOC104588206 [Nelumbo nucifera]|uniref:Phosphorylated adapter RNA export protein n=2 Tax=Nelumbo nucifera TaxID=4432 RepID=A0A1U8PYP5_NELNU|nr:PREDICTED: uncharacterized protein LOC104588206 [Nelumbo nucifera]XP_010244350.1 PREDICTED: uncharacterized protein LOC104588206 [Nelumbo nucifera]XP_019051663.1 PREDICTED: uncharacterized protein LOC104588206 [Nelumbo nucifera]DAD44498.1 TPA_asm: hypothetical protein HUJ06_002728 [Nelumbo nucifera]